MAKPNQLFKDAYNRCLLLLQEAPKLPPEPALAERLGVSRTTVRAILSELVHTGLLQWDKRLKVRLRPVEAADFFTEGETVPLATQIDDAVWRRLAASGVRPAVLNELAFARELGVGTAPLREGLGRFARAGLLAKRPNSHWAVLGLTAAYLGELFELGDALEGPAARRFVALPVDHAARAALAAAAPLADDLVAGEGSASELRFHRLLLAATGNRLVTEAGELLLIGLRFCAAVLPLAIAERERAAASRAAAVAALLGDDGDAAAAACHRHLAFRQQAFAAALAAATA